MLLFISTVLLTATLYRKPVKQWDDSMERERQAYKRLLAPSALAVSLFYIQTVLGAFFKHSAASEVYLGIEFSKRLIHSFALAEFIYAVHGIFSIVIVTSAIWAMFYAWRYQILQRISALFVVLTILETLIEFSVVLTGSSVLTSSMHMMTASVAIGVGAVLVGMTALDLHVHVKKEGNPIYHDK